jgi:hypothetical protein
MKISKGSTLSQVSLYSFSWYDICIATETDRGLNPLYYGITIP